MTRVDGSDHSRRVVHFANDHLYESYRVLGIDPPAIELAAQAIAEGDSDAATGHEGADKWFAALRALQ